MQTIQKQFVPYKIALAIKELGFNEMCIATFDEDKDFDLQNFEQNYDTFPSHIIAIPLWQQVIDWLREKYDINIVIHKCCHTDMKGIQTITYTNTGIPWDSVPTFQEAREQAILKAIELCKNK